MDSTEISFEPNVNVSTFTDGFGYIDKKWQEGEYKVILELDNEKIGEGKFRVRSFKATHDVRISKIFLSDTGKDFEKYDSDPIYFPTDIEKLFFKMNMNHPNFEEKKRIQLRIICFYRGYAFRSPTKEIIFDKVEIEENTYETDYTEDIELNEKLLSRRKKTLPTGKYMIIFFINGKECGRKEFIISDEIE